MVAGLTFGKNEGGQGGGDLNDPNTTTYPRGIIGNDSEVAFRLSGSYRLPWELVARRIARLEQRLSVRLDLQSDARGRGDARASRSRGRPRASRSASAATNAIRASPWPTCGSRGRSGLGTRTLRASARHLQHRRTRRVSSATTPRSAGPTSIRERFSRRASSASGSRSISDRATSTGGPDVGSARWLPASVDKLGWPASSAAETGSLPPVALTMLAGGAYCRTIAARERALMKNPNASLRLLGPASLSVR